MEYWKVYKNSVRTLHPYEKLSSYTYDNDGLKEAFGEVIEYALDNYARGWGELWRTEFTEDDYKAWAHPFDEEDIEDWQKDDYENCEVALAKASDILHAKLKQNGVLDGGDWVLMLTEEDEFPLRPNN